MKKKSLQTLKLNKKSISNLKTVKGGLESLRCSYAETCIWFGCYSPPPPPLPH
ncbi:hypothetical protein [Kordia sp.]|uniref:hypothetical protein n=1 Tax=Kordia sp. TaxID=1965332 RepID=UPI003D2B15CD